MLDAAGRKDVLERLEGLKGQRTVVHVTHHLEELLDADRILVLNAGRLLASVSPQGLISDAGFLEENRLTLPSTLRLATALGLGLRRTPEELAQAIVEKIGSEARAR
jgi:ABC-type multidrug transport system ATPase subunit